MSGGTDEKLVRMANQIASFFRTFPEEEAVAGIHDHVVAFWAPRMRNDLLARVDDDATGVDPLVVTAMHRLGLGLSPTHRETAGPGELGEIDASDAG